MAELGPTVLPELVVFDLDFTLWDCDGTWCDCLSPPFSKTNDDIVDRNRRWVRLYPDVISILDDCASQGIPLALASRTEQPEWAEQLVELLGIAHRFAYNEIYPSSKLRHFAALQRTSGIATQQMLFFDDEMRNITEVSTLGTTCVHVDQGMTYQLFQNGLMRFSEGR